MPDEKDEGEEDESDASDATGDDADYCIPSRRRFAADEGIAERELLRADHAD